MKAGLDIVELAKEVKRQSEAKRDFVADTRQIVMHPDTLELSLQDSDENFSTTAHTHAQIGAWADIPKRYYDKMMQASPALLAGNVNHWLHGPVKKDGTKKEARRMIRTIDGKARAFLSDRYRRLDNEDLAEAVLPILMQMPGVDIISADITEKKMYIKAILPTIQGEVKVGDVVQAGVTISNSEIGLGSFEVAPLIFRLSCLNGMKSPVYGLNKYHTGRQIDANGNDYEIFRDETLAADDRAFFMKVQDTVKAAFNDKVFNEILGKMRDAADSLKVVNPVKAVEELAKAHVFNEGEKNSVLESLIKAGDYSKWGVVNSITQVANTHESYDRASELEELGGRILELPATDWRKIAEAA